MLPENLFCKLTNGLSIFNPWHHFTPRCDVKIDKGSYTSGHFIWNGHEFKILLIIWPFYKWVLLPLLNSTNYSTEIVWLTCTKSRCSLFLPKCYYTYGQTILWHNVNIHMHCIAMNDMINRNYDDLHFNPFENGKPLNEYFYKQWRPRWNAS